METFSALLALCAGNSPVTDEIPAQRPVTQSFDVFFDLHLNQGFSKQPWGWWFETPSRPSWRHCNAATKCLGLSDNIVLSTETKPTCNHQCARLIPLNIQNFMKMCWYETQIIPWLSGVSNHQPIDCLLNRLFKRRSKETSKFRATGLCAGILPGTGEFPHKWTVTEESRFDEMAKIDYHWSLLFSSWWRHI